MRIKKSKFRALIREALITELFESNPYDYGGKPSDFGAKLLGQGRSKELTDFKGRQTYQDVTYEFKSDIGDVYDVTFTLMTTVYRGLPQDLDDPSDPDSYFWDISFGANGQVDMTHTSDQRVLPTIAKIVVDFYIDVLPTLHDSDVTTFGFVGVRERYRDFKDQSKRTRVYLGMIARYARRYGVNISTSPIPRHHIEPSAKASDIVKFKIEN